MKFKQVDVFTDTPFQGNPVAVVIGAEGLDTEAMQRIACWTNLSETTFLTKSTVADYKLRIFTPRQELPFAGHPTIGSAHAALESGFIPRKASFTQECGAGVLDLSFSDQKIFVKAPAPKITPAGKLLPFAGELLRVDVGPVWLTGEMESAKALNDLKPDMAMISSISRAEKASGFTLFAPSDDCVAAFHVRSFAPAQGIPEDPVCGSGNISVAAYLRDTGKLKDKSYVARQGIALGRDGRVHVRVQPDGIYLGGSAVTCVEGDLRVS